MANTASLLTIWALVASAITAVPLPLDPPSSTPPLPHNSYTYTYSFTYTTYSALPFTASISPTWSVSVPSVPASNSAFGTGGVITRTAKSTAIRTATATATTDGSSPSATGTGIARRAFSESAVMEAIVSAEVEAERLKSSGPATSSSAFATPSSPTTSGSNANPTSPIVIPLTTWQLAPTFTSLVPAFSITSFPDGASNLVIIPGPSQTVSPQPTYTTVPSDAEALTSPNADGTSPSAAGSNLLRVEYPAGSINPGNSVTPIGGGEFYATPMNGVGAAQNVSLEYSVYFPDGFDFVEGGKLPGLYGGHKGCSGGDAAIDCFSTRLMWRTSGLGELYLYAPKSLQSPSLCSTPPKSVCSAEYGLSIGRGAWTFQTGAWTHVRQDIWLNTPGQQDGGFNIFVNGQLVLSANDVYYRQDATAVNAASQQIFAAAMDTTGPDNTDEDSANSIMQVTDIIGFSPLMALVNAAGDRSQEDNPPVDPNEDHPTSDSSSDSDFSSHVIPHPSRAPPQDESTNTTSGVWAEVLEVLHEPEADGGDDDDAGIATVTIGTVFLPTSTALVDDTAADEDDATDSVLEAQPMIALAGPPDLNSSVVMVTATQTRLATVTVTATSTVRIANAIVTQGPASNSSAPSSSYMSPIELVDYTVIPTSPGVAARSMEEDGQVGFIGIFFSTFFGGHAAEWASPTDQYTYFKDFSMRINA